MSFLLVVLVTLGACRSAPAPKSEPAAARTALESFCGWREAERRREPARGAPFLAPGVGRRELEAHFEALGPRKPGPVRTPIEFVLLGERSTGDGTLHGALEPRGRGHSIVFFETVRVGVDLCLVPGGRFGVLSGTRSAEELLAAERERWGALHGPELAASQRELLWLLEIQVEAAQVAAERQLHLAPFDPPPEVLLAQLRALSPEAARELVLSRLETPGH